MKELLISEFHGEMLKNGWHLYRIDKDRGIVEYRLYLLTLMVTKNFSLEFIFAIAEPKQVVESITQQTVCDLALTLFEKIKERR